MNYGLFYKVVSLNQFSVRTVHSAIANTNLEWNEGKLYNQTTADSVERDIKRNIYTKNDFIDVFTGHLSGRFVFTHRILDQDEADSVIKDSNLSEIK